MLGRTFASRFELVNFIHKKIFLFPKIRAQLGSVNADDSSKMGVAIACYLAQQGADIYRRNLQGKSPLSMIGDAVVAEILRGYAA